MGGIRRSPAMRGVARLLRGDLSFREFAGRAYRHLTGIGPTTTLRSHSQAQQDIFYALLFAGHPGVFVDVGARDGVVISNTYVLEQRYGWTGLCVEPHPKFFGRLQKNRRCGLVNAAVADVDPQGETMEFAIWKDGPGGYSGLVDVEYRHKAKLDQHAHEIIEVPCLPLHKVLSDAAITCVDVLDIDVEGAEGAVIRSIDFERCHFNVISVERASEEVQETLTRNGFSLLTTLGEDAVYRNDVQIASGATRE